MEIERKGEREKAPQISIIGCGWLGLPLATSLIAEGCRLSGSTTRAEKLPLLREKGINAVQFKLDSYTKPSIIPPDLLKCQTLILTIPPSRRALDGGRSYPQKIENLLKAIKDSPVQNLLFISSTSVYPSENQIVNSEELIAHEDTDQNPLREAERILSNAQGVKLSILRFAGLVGPGRLPGRFLAGKKALPNGDAFINLIHLQDCIGIIKKIVMEDHWNKTFHAAAPQHPRKREYYPVMAKKLNLSPPEFQDKGPTKYKVIHSTKIIRELNYKFQFPDPFSFT